MRGQREIPRDEYGSSVDDGENIGHDGFFGKPISGGTVQTNGSSKFTALKLNCYEFLTVTLPEEGGE